MFSLGFLLVKMPTVTWETAFCELQEGFFLPILTSNSLILPASVFLPHLINNKKYFTRSGIFCEIFVRFFESYISTKSPILF